MQDKQTKKANAGLGGFLGGIAHLVESLGTFMEKVEAAGGQMTREGEISMGPQEKGMKAVYGVTVRLGRSGKEFRVEPFGNVSTGKRGEPVVSEMREPLLDMFEEPDHVVVVAELPGIEESEISLELQGDVLVLKADGARSKFYKELLIPCTPASFTSSYQNGILEVRLARPQPTAKKSSADAGPEPSSTAAPRKKSSRDR